MAIECCDRKSCRRACELTRRKEEGAAVTWRVTRANVGQGNWWGCSRGTARIATRCSMSSLEGWGVAGAALPSGTDHVSRAQIT
mgnify:CR=1 FL=1